MVKRQPSEAVDRSNGLTVQPSGRGWKLQKALVYTFAFEFEIETDEESWLIGNVPALPGCQSQARTEEELIELLHEAVELAIEDSSDPLAKGLFATKANCDA
jgi:predicted RNase H-like HicB family nuclease